MNTDKTYTVKDLKGHPADPDGEIILGSYDVETEIFGERAFVRKDLFGRIVIFRNGENIRAGRIRAFDSETGEPIVIMDNPEPPTGNMFVVCGDNS